MTSLSVTVITPGSDHGHGTCLPHKANIDKTRTTKKPQTRKATEQMLILIQPFGCASVAGGPWGSPSLVSKITRQRLPKAGLAPRHPSARFQAVSEASSKQKDYPEELEALLADLPKVFLEGSCDRGQAARAFSQLDLHRCLVIA